MDEENINFYKLLYKEYLQVTVATVVLPGETDQTNFRKWIMNIHAIWNEWEVSVYTKPMLFSHLG